MLSCDGVSAVARARRVILTRQILKLRYAYWLRDSTKLLNLLSELPVGDHEALAQIKEHHWQVLVEIEAENALDYDELFSV